MVPSVFVPGRLLSKPVTWYDLNLCGYMPDQFQVAPDEILPGEGF